MNTTTEKSTVVTTTLSQTDLLYAYFKNPVIVIRFYQTGYVLTFILGFVGNTASLMTFSRPTLRKVSTGCLFIALAISDMSYLLITIIDILEFGIQIPFYRHVPYNELCRFRIFIMSEAQIVSAWILVLVSVDRWIRTRFPFKSGSLCTPKKAIMAVVILIVIDVGLHSHILTPMSGGLVPGFSFAACGSRSFTEAYFEFYYFVWSIVQVFLSCLIPVTLMLLILIDIMISIRLRKRALVQPNQAWQNNPNANRQKALQKQMFILMIASICIFFVTSLPVAIYKATSPRQNNLAASIFQILTIGTSLGWVQSLNYAVGFYIHCLSSTLFRKQFLQLMPCTQNVNQSPVSLMVAPRTLNHGQTIPRSAKY